MDKYIEVTKADFHKAMRKRFKNNNDYIYEESKDEGNTVVKFLDIRSKQVLAFILNGKKHFIANDLA